MKISIITVCLNSEKTIRDTITSVLSQNFADVEYIIIDGGSKDKTLSIVHEYEDSIDKIVSEPDEGLYDAMNKGISFASGEVIGILNSDDFFENDNIIKVVVNAFEQNPTVDLVFGDLVYVRPNNLGQIIRYYSSLNFRSWKPRFGWIPPHPATFIKRSVYEKFGVYNLSFKIAADYDFFVRVLQVHKLSFYQIPKVLVRMRIGGVSTSGFRNSYRLTQEIVKACKLNGIYTNLFFVLTKIPFKLIELYKRPK